MKKSQELRVLEYLQAGHKLSSLHAREELGIIDLPKRVSVLRQRGCKIAGVTVNVKNRFGETVRVKQYSIPCGQTEMQLGE
jgi:hypothetical protein